MQKLLPIFFFLLGTKSVRSQTAVYVDSSVTTSGSGTSWSNAYKTLSEALAIVNAASTSTKYVVYVAKGFYYPTGIQASTNRDSAFLVIRGGISIEGGYPTGGGTRNITANPTVLSGNIGLTTDTTDNSFHVLVIAGITTTDTVSLSGMAIYGGAANGNTSQTKSINGKNVNKAVGGGLYADGNFGSLLISDCTFYRNAASYYGGGMYRYALPSSGTSTSSTAKMILTNCSFVQNNGTGEGGGLENWIDGASDTLYNCTFSGNKANYGGGAHFEVTSRTGAPSYLTLNGCNFTGNSVSTQGGGMSVYTSTYYNAGASATAIKNCTFSGNYGASGGGLLSSVGSGTTTKKGNVYITGCNFINNTASDGGGLYNYVNGSATTIATTLVNNCRMTGNIATGSGGGMYNYVAGADSLTISSTLDSGNTGSYYGGGIYNHASVIMDSVVIINNKGAAYGGGVYNTAGSPQISRCLIAGNKAVTYGGGVYNLSSSPVLKNCLISGNLAMVNGGAMYNYTSSSPSLVNCTLSGDSALAGVGLYDTGSSSAVVLNSIIWEGINAVRNASGSSAGITYSIVSGGYTGTGNLSANPLFVSPAAPGTAPTFTGNYALLPCSPAIEAGNNTGSYTGLKDFSGNSRLFGTNVDLGAYEIQSVFPSPITSTANSICGTGTLQLSNAISGGTWTSRNATIATVSSTGLVVGITAGVDTINYSYTTGSCSGTATKIITINALPTAGVITGPAAVCANAQATLSNTTLSGVWSSSNTSIASISAGGVLTGIAAGTDTVKYTVTNITTGCSNAAIAVVAINAQPVVAAITGSHLLCGNATILLNNATAGGVWASRDTGIAIISGSGLASPHRGGNTVISYSVTNAANCTDSALFPLLVDTADVTITQTGPLLIAVAQINAQYQWVDCGQGNIPIPGASAPSFSANANGSYAVRISKNGCNYASACKTVSGLEVNGYSPGMAALQIYPNPGNGILTVLLPGCVPHYIHVTDITGKYLLEVRPTTDKTEVDLSPFGPGTYLVEVSDGTTRKTMRVSIRK